MRQELGDYQLGDKPCLTTSASTAIEEPQRCHLNVCTLGSVLLKGFTVHHSLALWPNLAGWLYQGLVSTSFWSDQDTTRMQKPHATTGVATVHNQRPMPISPDLPQLLSSGNFASRLQQHAWYKLADSSFWQKK